MGCEPGGALALREQRPSMSSVCHGVCVRAGVCLRRRLHISDIGGFAGNPVDGVFHTEGPELYLRWLQWGAYSPILRTHCRYCEQRVWTWGDGWFDLMRRPLVLRSNMVPYTYTHAAVLSYGAGEALLTPTYWDPAAATEVRWRMRLTRIGDD